jgi:hypothetical protein
MNSEYNRCCLRRGIFWSYIAHSRRWSSLHARVTYCQTLLSAALRPRQAVAVRPPTQRLAAHASDTACRNTLPGARATDLEQPSCWHRLPPPCAMQWSVSSWTAALEQPACWQRLPPPCALQWSEPSKADLVQPSSWHRLPPPCALLTALAPTVRLAVGRANNSGIEAALVLAPFAPAVRDALLRAAGSSCLGTSRLLAPPAASVRLAVGRAACLSRLETALVLAPPAPPMRLAVPRVASR